jgi:hypothetical protein
MKKEVIKKTLLGAVVSIAIAYGVSNDLRQFSKTFVMSGLGCASVAYWFENRKKTDKRVEELEGLLNKKQTDERVTVLENMLEESDNVIAEQEDVIKNYEGVLDEASVKFPCNCGNNMFDGIFKPLEEFVVECDHCNNKYAITLKLESVLLTEPLEDLNIDKLIKQNTDDKDRN